MRRRLIINKTSNLPVYPTETSYADRAKQFRKAVQANNNSSELNTRTFQENFPKVERKLDTLSFENKFSMEFTTTDHKHNIRFNLRLSPPADCFICNAGNDNPPQIFCDMQLPDPGTMIADGNAHPVTFPGFINNQGDVTDGDFLLDTVGQIIVPKDGYYDIQVTSTIVGVTISDVATELFSIRHNGVVISQVAYAVKQGTLPTPIQFFTIATHVNGLCMLCKKGDTIGPWVAADGIGFAQYFDFPSSDSVSIKLVGLA